MAPRFCAECGQLLVHGPVAGRIRPHCPACGHVVFHNPVPVGLALVKHAGQLLLVRRGQPPLQGYWAPPGGHVEIDESVEAAIVREIEEEAGVEVVLDGLAGVYSQEHVGVMIVAYRGRVVGGEPKAGEDAAAVDYFEPGKLPDQPPPAAGTVVDAWFYGVLNHLLAPWKEGVPCGALS